MSSCRRKGLPRMRGDRPRIASIAPRHTAFTPHARGSTTSCAQKRTQHLVYPACAGIDLCFSLPSRAGSCLPRMRGDRPKDDVEDFFEEPFTPHARGSTFRVGKSCPRKNVYPACAGIDLKRRTKNVVDNRLPRMRGDRPLAATT